MKVAVIGGAGHVGLGLCLVLADSGHFVYGIDIDQKKNKQIMNNNLPFREEMGKEYLKKAIEKKRLKMTSDISVLSDSEVIIVSLGTPVDEYFNPVISDLIELTYDICKNIKEEQLIILRSTVSPGTTRKIKDIIERDFSLKIGTNIYLVYAPERVMQGKAIMEIKSLPQLIGAFDDCSYQKAEEFFQTFVKNKCIKLSPVEAELGKLITNMTRYVEFALANEYYLIADSYNANIHKIIDACNFDYPRLNIPSPGPNVGGPCLYKDGWFLLERIPFNELISTSFRINEGVVAQIIKKIKDYDIKKVSILGMTFKANSDDIRNSCSFKLKKQLEFSGYQLILVEPNLKKYDLIENIKHSDCIILMTPHDEFKDLNKMLKYTDNEDCLYVDIWGFWEEMKYKSKNGLFWGREVPK